MKRTLVSLILASLLISTLPLNVSADATEDIPTNAAATGVHDSLVAALTHANLVATLQGDGPFTVFAPTDQAFIDAGIDLSTFDTDAENATLADILTYHVVAGKVMSTDLSDSTAADALNGDKLSFSVSTSEVKVNGAIVTGADVETSNGVIHVIDKVLMPPMDVFVSDGSMTAPYYQFFTDSAGTDAMTEVDITKNYKFQRLNNPSTHPFYISDSGYEADSSAKLLIAGDGTSTTGISNDESFTVFFKDGFTVEDTLSYFCTVHSGMFADFTLTQPVVLVDIPTVATSTGVHDSLVAALAKANLVATLQGDGPFTVFAPTDTAFADAGIDLDAFVTDEEIATLADILLYHVYSGAVAAADVVDGLTVTMVNGDDASFTVAADGSVMVGDANVTTADVQASNGVVHVIDKVLMPPADPVVLSDIPTIAQSTGVHDSLVAALTKANLVATLQGDGPFTVFAPTDTAFADAGIDLDAFVTDEEIATLADILLYHVYSGAVAAADVVDGLTVTMVNGDDASFTVAADGSVMVGDANVTTADVQASNGVVHVIDKVLMPPADPVVEPELTPCDAVVRIAPSGMKFSPSEVTITAGQTVCWQWEDESMAHNVREVDGDQSSTYTANGVTSGLAMTTLDFRYTFDEDSSTFYYACEPHLAAGMFGKVIVGDGGVVATPPPADNSMDSDEESVPGFLVAMTTIALAGAAFVSSRRFE